MELKTDREYKIYNSGIEEGTKHSTSAPDTLRRLNNVENNMVTKDMFHSKIDDLKEFFNEKFKANECSHAKILEQQAKTNGSVKDLKAWRFALAMSWTVVTIMFPVMFYYFMIANDLKVEKKIQTMIEINNSKYFEND